MAKPLIGRTVRRLRSEKGLTQQTLAARLGISASYLNLIEHDQRAVTASVLIKLTEALGVDLAALSGHAERQLEAGLREVLADPLLGVEAVPEAEVQAMAAAAPNAARGVLALYRAWRVAREDASGIALPSGRRILLPNEEARDFFHERANHFVALEDFAGKLAAELDASPAEMNHSIAERLRHKHDVRVTVAPMSESLRRYDPATRVMWLSESVSRESRGFRMAFQLALMEGREAVEATMASHIPSTPEAASLIRIGLLNYAAAALLMPYAAFLSAARALRHDVEGLSARFGVSFEQAAQRLSTMQREGARGVPFFFLRVDPAGNVDKRFSAAGFPFARFGGSCPKWVVHHAFESPGQVRVQIAELPDGATFLCFARASRGPSPRWGEPAPIHVIAMGCDISRAAEVVYADGLDITAARVGIGLSCRLCPRPDCRSRAFPPLEHRLQLDANEDGATLWRFEAKS
jgi:predicted transcriptional regulator/transcriptional regulator with XRE-family HTH domain